MIKILKLISMGFWVGWGRVIFSTFEELPPALAEKSLRDALHLDELYLMRRWQRGYPANWDQKSWYTVEVPGTISKNIEIND